MDTSKIFTGFAGNNNANADNTRVVFHHSFILHPLNMYSRNKPLVCPGGLTSRKTYPWRRCEHARLSAESTARIGPRLMSVSTPAPQNCPPSLVLIQTYAMAD